MHILHIVINKIVIICMIVYLIYLTTYNYKQDSSGRSGDRADLVPAHLQRGDGDA